MGKIEYNLTSHSLNTQVATITTKDAFVYTTQDQLLLRTHQIILPSPAPAGAINVLSNNTYNSIGQLTSKKVGDTDPTGTNYFQKVDYTYNVRGWLKGINDIDNLQSGTDKRDLFAYKIGHDDSALNQQFNGNISETTWRTNNDNIKRKYSYQFDELNRLTNAVYSKPQLASHTNNYGESASYDQNGNILSMVRYGNYDTNGYAFKMDDLAYKYADNSNKLLMVYDATNSTQGFKDNASAAISNGDDYDYDASGNLRVDNNKTITKIRYNHLNLPCEITFANSNTKITYIYNAAGIKLQKLVKTTATAQRQTDYFGGFQYLKVSATGIFRLQFFPIAEGYISVTYINATTNSYNYVFNYLDHLGNVRLSYGKDPTQTTTVLRILEENNYYPYGLKHANYNADLNAYQLLSAGQTLIIKAIPPISTVASDVALNKYKFNGQELQDELGLNLYDMDLRDYDPAIARWTGQDPVTHFSQSPYNAFDGNPVFWADPSGADSIIYGMSGQTANANQYSRGHSSFGNASYSSNYSDPLRKGTGSGWGDRGLLAVINSFIKHSLAQNLDSNGSYKSSLTIFSASEDVKAMKFLIDNSNDGYGNFIEMAALITTESTFVFSDSRNTEFFSYIDFGSYKGRGTMLGNKSFFDGQRILAQVHTHNEHSEISSPDFATSAFFKVPVYAIDIASQMVGRGNDFRSIENANGRKYDSTTNVSSVNSLLNNNFNIRNDAKNLLLRFGL